MQTLLKQSIIGGLSFLLLTGIAFSVGSSEPSVFEGEAASNNVIISEVYGGGGNSGAAFNADFIELFNRSTTSASLTGWSIQYTSTTGQNSGSWSVQNLSGTIKPFSYLLIRLQNAGATGAALPTPDITGTTINASGTGGKIALMSTQTATAAIKIPTSNLIDFLGWGAADRFEGTAAAPATTNATSVFRTNVLSDSDANSTDFTTGTPTPKNSSTLFSDSALIFANKFFYNTQNKEFCSSTENWSNWKTEYENLSIDERTVFRDSSNSEIVNARDRYNYFRNYNINLIAWYES
jgi:predicted extracellular nuclease